ncbi:MAG: hypothetical protein PHO29_12575, partial [Acetobacterium sp.]|nr:hypothetical protein [Acetobacterium sp.]
MKLEDEEREWRRSRIRLPPRELMTAFPEAKPIIREKLKEYEEKKEELDRSIKDKLDRIAAMDTDNFSKWFYREWVKVTDIQEVLK